MTCRAAGAFLADIALGRRGRFLAPVAVLGTFLELGHFGLVAGRRRVVAVVNGIRRAHVCQGYLSVMVRVLLLLVWYARQTFEPVLQVTDNLKQSERSTLFIY